MVQTYANYYQVYYLKNRKKILAYLKRRREWAKAVKKAEAHRLLIEREEAERASRVVTNRPGSVTSL